MKLAKRLMVFVKAFIFLAGLGIFLYPICNGRLTDYRIYQEAEEFLSWVELAPYYPDSDPPSAVEAEEQEESTEPAVPEIYTDLWQDMRAYNLRLYEDGQRGLNCQLAYETPSFSLMNYGLEDEIFAVISIPKLELEMPVYLGASYQHMADGAALLSQTSIPIGGSNTNSVIAGHRGWRGASYFRYITDLSVGDTVTITNLWEELTYRVCAVRIIEPYEVEKILIQPNKELVTLLTCHPYASGGKQRYLVICERVEV